MSTARPAPADAADDGELVRSSVSGDRSAFAAIYDRYADRLYDSCVGMLGDRDAAADCVQDVFVTAATRLRQLNEPDRLASWLYAIARNEALGRIRARRREQPREFLPERASREPGPELLAARSELADLITQACGGLSDRDRAVLELSYRRGLDGAELADALGVSLTNAHTLVGRMRDNIERSLGALLVCRGARSGVGGCPELAALVEHWDGRFTVLLRKRVARHIDGCAACEQDRRRRVNPVALLGSAPILLPAPAWLHDHTLTLVARVVALPPAPSTVPTGAGPSTPGVGSGSGGDRTWWPPPMIDITDLGGVGPVMKPPRPGTAPYVGTPSRPAPMMKPPVPVYFAGPAAPPPVVPEPSMPGRFAPSPVPASPPPPGPSPSGLYSPDPKHHPPMPLPTDSAPGHVGGQIRLGGHLRTVLLVALLLLVLVGGLLLGPPLFYRVWPASSSVPGGPAAPAPMTSPAGSAPTRRPASAPPSTPSSSAASTAPAQISTAPAGPAVQPSSRTAPPQPSRTTTAAVDVPATVPAPPNTSPPSVTATPAGGDGSAGPTVAPVVPMIPGLGAPSIPTPAVQIPTPTPAAPTTHPAAPAPNPPGGGSSSRSLVPPESGSIASTPRPCPPIVSCSPINGIR